MEPLEIWNFDPKGKIKRFGLDRFSEWLQAKLFYWQFAEAPESDSEKWWIRNENIHLTSKTK